MTGTSGSIARVPYPEEWNELTVGQGTAERTDTSSAGQSTGTGNLRLAYFTARKSDLVTQVRAISSGTAAGATPTLVRFGLYSIAANGDGTLVAATVNDTTIFAAASTAYTRNLSASYQMVLGQRYAAGILVVTGATAPTILGGNIGDSNEFAMAPRINGVIVGQADLPASFLALAGGAATRPYMVFLP